MRYNSGTMEVVMNSNKKDKNWIYHLIIAVLVVILIVVSFCMLSIHVPYFNHENDIALERNKIINKYKLNYDDYFNEYNSSKTYYIIRIKDKKKKKVYQVYNTKYKLVDSYSGSIAKQEDVINTINNEYKVNVSSLSIGYENGDLVYFGKYQNDEHLYYFYYSLDEGNVCEVLSSMSTEMLKDYQCIDFKKLLLLKGKSIGLKDEETHILLLMMTLSDLGVRPIYPQKIEEFSSLSIKEIDDIMIRLVDKHYLDRINLKIDFKPLEKLLLGMKVEKKEEVNLVEIFEDAFGRTMSTMDIEYINQFKRTGYDDEMIVSALREAVKSNALSFRYIERVLENWAHSKNYIKKYQEEEPEISEEVRNYNWWEND